MRGEFLAVIKSECVSFFAVGTQCRDDSCANSVRAFVCSFDQKSPAASSINDGDENGAGLQTNDGIQLVVSKSGSVLDFWRSGADTALTWNVSSPFAGRVSFPI